jgi:hypothetical protein
MTNRTNRRTMQHILAIALITCTVPSSGQEPMLLADNGGHPVASSMDGRKPSTSERASHQPITDDGQRGDAVVPTSQLVIAFSEEERMPLTIDIMDDAGRCVQQLAFTSHEGRNMLPIDVTGLAQGRYAVRVQGGGATTISRFERD